jgi:hypothetical protein
MMRIELDYEEWQKVMAIVATAPWNVANPLLMKMGAQLQEAAHAAQVRVGPGNGLDQHPGNDPVRTSA